MSAQVDVLAVMRDGAADYDESGHDGLAADMRKAIRAVSSLIAERDALREVCQTLVDAEHEEDPMFAGMLLACAYEAAKAALTTGESA